MSPLLPNELTFHSSDENNNVSPRNLSSNHGSNRSQYIISRDYHNYTQNSQNGVESGQSPEEEPEEEFDEENLNDNFSQMTIGNLTRYIEQMSNEHINEHMGNEFRTTISNYELDENIEDIPTEECTTSENGQAYHETSESSTLSSNNSVQDIEEPEYSEQDIEEPEYTSNHLNSNRFDISTHVDDSNVSLHHQSYPSDFQNAIQQNSPSSRSLQEITNSNRLRVDVQDNENSDVDVELFDEYIQQRGNSRRSELQVFANSMVEMDEAYFQTIALQEGNLENEAIELSYPNNNVDYQNVTSTQEQLTDSPQQSQNTLRYINQLRGRRLNTLSPSSYNPYYQNYINQMDYQSGDDVDEDNEQQPEDTEYPYDIPENLITYDELLLRQAIISRRHYMSSRGRHHRYSNDDDFLNVALELMRSMSRYSENSIQFQPNPYRFRDHNNSYDSQYATTYSDEYHEPFSQINDSYRSNSNHHDFENSNSLSIALSEIFSKNFTPIFSKCKVLLSLKLKKRYIYNVIISQLGGEVFESFSENVNVAIFEYKNEEDKDWRRALEYGIHILSPQWIEACIQARTLIPPYKSCLHWPVLRSPLGIQEMHDLVISVTGFIEEERSDLKQLIRACGAKYSGALSKRENTHLICCQSFGEKYRKALEWNIKVVNKRWLYDCIIKWSYLPEKPYQDICVLR